MALSSVDAFVYAVMVGLGEAWFIADAVRLGADASEIALLVGLPLAVGAAGPLLSLRLLARVGRRKPVVVGAAALQAAILLALAALSHGRLTTVPLLIGVATAYQICAQSAGTAWSSWYGDLVPATVRGGYFARRNRGAYAGTLVALVLGGLMLHRLEPVPPGAAASDAGVAGGLGFALAYLLAGLARVGSVGLLAASCEGPFSGLPDRARVGRFLRTERGSGVWRLVLLVGLLHLTVYVASPFFNPYMLRDLRFTYTEYMAASVCLVLVKVLVLPLWGRWIDRNGPLGTLGRGGVLLALVPLAWVFADGLWGVLLCQSLSGLAWSGFEVGNFSLLLELGYRRMRPTIFAAQSVVTGSAQLLGGLLGGAMLERAIDPRTVFGTSSAARLLVVLLLVKLLPRRAPRAPGEPRPRRPVFRVTGFRPGTGLGQRPIQESAAPLPVPSEPDGSPRAATSDAT